MKEYDIIYKLTQVGDGILETSKSKIYMAMRFLAMAFDGLKYALSGETDTMGTDGYYLYYSPAFLMTAYKENERLISRIYLHSILHCIFRHVVGKDDRDEALWNLSCDIAVENIIDSINNRNIKENLSAEKRQIYAELKAKLKTANAEAIYRWLESEDIDREKIHRLERLFYRDDHSFWKVYDENNDFDDGGEGADGNGDGKDGKDGDGDGDSQGNGTAEYFDDIKKAGQKQIHNKEDFNDKWKDISEKTQTDMDTFSKEMADEAGALMEYVRIENRPRYDYKEFLRRFSVNREVTKLDLDSYDYIYYTYGLKVYGNMPLIESLEYKDSKKVEDFVIVLDTSASCSGELIKGFLSETYNILSESESFFRKINLHLIQCDSKVQEDQIITCREEFEKYMDSFEIKGMGGTDFVPAFDYVNGLCEEKKIPDLKGLIYFTDGYGKYPKKMPKYETAFVFLAENYDDSGVPPWAVEIVVDSEEFYKAARRI
ncbi:MAG: metallopeptidase [Firmicutes bacterium]|nr:metallopeptidase [Bacillota bacterium]